MDPEPVDLDRWGLHCYCPEASRTPHRLVREPGVWPLLLRLRTPTPADVLEQEGVPPDRVRALLAEDLLTDDDGRLRTTVPVLGPSVMAPVRASSAASAARVAEALTPLVTRILAALQRRGWQRSGYAVCFGYLLDGLLWSALRARHALPPTALTGRARWAGLFWAIQPRRDGPGVNFTTAGRRTLVQVWDAATADGLAALARHPGLPAVLADAGHGAAGHPGLASHFVRDGAPAVPVLLSADPLHELCVRGAELVATELVDHLVPGLASALALPPTSRTVVVAHELIWDVLEHLFDAGLCARPGPHAAGTSLADRLLITDWRRP